MNKTIYALGFFDGVHVGHAALLDRCKTLAREENYRAGVVTFAAHPDTLVLGNPAPHQYALRPGETPSGTLFHGAGRDAAL